MARSALTKDDISAAWRTLTYSGRFDAAALDLLVDAACNGRARPADLATTYLALLSPTAAEVRQAVTRMAGDDRWQVRERAVRAAHPRSPREFAEQLVRAGLADPHERVRAVAADRAVSSRLAELVPELERLSRAEGDPRAKQCLQRAVGLLRDGYWLEPDEPGTFRLVVLEGDGATPSTLVTQAELEARGPQALAAELR